VTPLFDGVTEIPDPAVDARKTPANGR
jgi:hypothetical protein